MASNSSLVILFIIIICNASPLDCESTEKVSHQKYDIVKMVHDASARISLTENLNKIVDGKLDSLIDELDIFDDRNFNPLLTEILKNNGSDNSSKCDEDLLYVSENLMPMGGWASKMIDSFGKPERGIFQGNLHWLGDFNECIGVHAPIKPTESNFTVGDFHGQYCTLQLTAQLGNISLPIRIGVCLPDSCHPSNEKKLVGTQIFVPRIQNGSKSIFSDAKLTCTPKFEKFTAAAICVMFLISIFILLALTGSLITAYENFGKIETSRRYLITAGFDNRKTTSVNNGDIVRQSFDLDDDASVDGNTKTVKLPAWLEQCKPFLSCFCVFTNGAKLLDTSDSEGQLPCLHGIRFLSLSWVIVCHTYAFAVNYIRNMGEILPAIDNWPFQIIMNGFYSVDSFFLLSGFLLAYLFFEVASKNNGKVPWLYFYIHRYVRLTPVYMIMLGFYAAVYPYMGSGPFWTAFEIEPHCAKNWWRNLLYINNFSDNADMCVGWSWYLSSDMQFFVISPLFLITLWRWPPIGYAILALFMSATTIISFVISYQNELVTGLGNILVDNQPQAFMTGKWMDFFNFLYVRPYARIGPYIIGVALAYYLYKRKQNNGGKTSLVILSSGWLIASTITLACMFGLYHRHMSNLEASFYNAFNRTCFAGGLAWVIFVCLTDQGGFINSFLSFKLFIPLSRLTYCAYLVHPIVMSFHLPATKSTLEFSHFTLVILYLGYLVMSYGAAFITSLLFESPVIKLDKLVRSKLSKK